MDVCVSFDSGSDTSLSALALNDKDVGANVHRWMAAVSVETTLCLHSFLRM